MLMFNQYEYTLKEAVDVLSNRNVEMYDTTTFKDIFMTSFANAPLWTNSEAKPYIERLWQIVLARHFNDYVGFTDIPINQTIAKHLLAKIINHLVLTYDKYSTLFKAYDDKKSDLLGAIKSQSKHSLRHNNTPQIPENSDEYEGDGYVSDLTNDIGETSSDGDTPINRLKELETNYTNLLLKWASEFDNMLIEG